MVGPTYAFSDFYTTVSKLLTLFGDNEREVQV